MMKQEDLIAEAKEFFECYKKEIGNIAKEGKKSIPVSFQDLASFSPQLTEMLIHQPNDILSLLGVALEESGLITGAKIILTDLSPSQVIKIRDIRSKHLSQLISIEGIVKQASEIRPQVVNSIFECPSCGSTMNVLQTEDVFREPSKCSCGRKGNFRLVSKEMIDVQRLVIEESPEDLGGEQPRHLSVFLREDLVAPIMEKRTTPGSKVDVIGVLNEVPIPSRSGGTLTRYDLAIEANNVIPKEETFEELIISEEEEKQIKELSTDPDLYMKLTNSIAPSVFGYDEIKEALALQLFGGVRRQKSDGTYARGDMHMLLVGDPGVAKSHLLKFITNLSPKGRYISGKAATGAGITATVVKDEFLRGWSLEAGAIVLANKGLLAIDELEDMDPNDRSALHEGMEQQTITISKANVQATLKAETSILAAGNPKFGRFNINSPNIARQINIDPALLNRFDLIFIIQDVPERVRDEAIATHVLEERTRKDRPAAIDLKLLKKYIAYAKQRVTPELTEGAIEEIRNFYVALRSSAGAQESEEALPKPIPITARQLEALMRLSEANAKARLSKKVTSKDARNAIRLLKFCLQKVCYDPETQQYDIDKISIGMPTSQRNKIIFVRDVIRKLEERHGKLVPKEAIITEIGDKISTNELSDLIDELRRAGEFFEPKRGFIQRAA